MELVEYVVRYHKKAFAELQLFSSTFIFLFLSVFKDDLQLSVFQALQTYHIARTLTLLGPPFFFKRVPE